MRTSFNAQQENARRKKNPLPAKTIPWWGIAQNLRLKERGKEEGSSSKINIC